LPQANSILSLAIIVLTGYFGAKLFRKVHFPAVTAYLLIGILIGPHVLNLVAPKIINISDFISNFVLGIIAFSLGENFTIKDIKSAGKAVIWISILEAICAWIIVTLVMIIYSLLCGMPVHPAFVLGAAAAATAPAATVMVIREYRAKGIVTEMLLRVVAIDDAWCLIFTAFAITIANALNVGVFNVLVISKSFIEVLTSLFFGGIAGFGLHYLSKFIVNKEELLVLTLGFILLLVGLSIRIHLSPLLTTMVAGVMIANISKNRSMFFENLRQVDSILFLAFFILVGVNLDIGIIPKIGLMGLLYIMFRIIGKFIGVHIGAKRSHADPRITRYLAWGLVPQAGVALGVALSAKTLYPSYGEIIFTTIAATTVIYELIGPFCAKYGLKKAGEII
jgi:Kef-type K+ transport system membrane component KefB